MEEKQLRVIINAETPRDTKEERSGFQSERRVAADGTTFVGQDTGDATYLEDSP